MTSPISTISALKGVSAQQLMLQHKLFKQLDSNGDKALSLKDLKDSQILGKLGKTKNNSEVEGVFDKLDADQNGSLSENESRSYFTDALKASPATQALVTLMVSQEKEPATPTWSSWLSNVYDNQRQLKSLHSDSVKAAETKRHAAVSAWKTAHGLNKLV